MTIRHPAFAAVAGCVALAAASLLAPAEPVYDAWAWLVWGRELAGFGLDTSSGPSFKPLPVALTTVLSLAGGAAPALWLALVRAAWLLGLVLAGALAWRLTAGYERRLRIAAAAFAALSLMLLADSFTMWTRQGAAGMSEPPLVALVLAAILAALDGRTRAALLLGVLAALIRPEAWPLLGAYGLWCARREPPLRPWLVACAVAVPALWVAPDLLASGGGASGGERAVRGGGAPLHELAEVFARAAVMPLLVAWPLALFGVARGAGLERAVLAAVAAAWIAIVAVMAAAGFAGLPRFMAPAAALVGVLAGVGLARLLALVLAPAPRRGVVALVLAALLAGTLAELPDRVAELPHAMTSTARIARSHDRLRDLAGQVGRAELLRCGRLATSDVLVRTALAWELRASLSDVVSFGKPPTRSGAFVVGTEGSPRLRADLAARGELLGKNGEWRVYSLDCPRSGAAAASSSASVRSAGVSGAQR
jgi:hypothetical protein